MLGTRCSVTDRRCGVDRGREHNLDYFSNGGVERRSWQEQRSQVERRRDWLRVTKWSSVLAENGGLVLKGSKLSDTL